MTPKICPPPVLVLLTFRISGLHWSSSNSDCGLVPSTKVKPQQIKNTIEVKDFILIFLLFSNQLKLNSITDCEFIPI